MAIVKPQRKKAKQAAPEVLLFAAEFDLFSGSEVPDSFEILPPSGFTGRDVRGPFTYEFDTLQGAFVANAQDLPIDRDHKILLPPQLPDPTAGEALGWIKQIAKNERGGVNTLTAELNSLKQAAADKHIADEVEALIANSCLLPAQREAAVSIAKTSGLDALKS